MDLIFIAQNRVFVKNPRKMLIAPDDAGNFHVCADIANGEIPHLVPLTKDGYMAEQLVQGYLLLLAAIEVATNSEYSVYLIDFCKDIDFSGNRKAMANITHAEALKIIADMQG